MSNDIARKMEAIGSELQGMERSQALALLDQRIANEADAEFAWELRISKAKLLSSMGRHQEAVDLLGECSMATCANESAAYFAAEILVESGRYAEAADFLRTAERQMETSGVAYYKNCVFLLHAFCEAKMGRTDQARQFLNEVEDDDESLFWLKVDPAISVSYVRNFIAERG